MKQLYRLLGIGATSAFVIAPGAQAQETQPAATPVIEIYQCSYRGANDAADLRAVTTRFNAWADRNNVRDYSAFVATPYAYSADLEADVLWIGAWPNGRAMGVDEALYFAQGAEVSAAFDAVVDCNAHALYAEVIVNRPPGEPSQNPIAMFEDCTVHAGRTDEEALVALGQWAEYAKGRGSDDFSAVLFPIAGLAGDVDYNFKLVTGFQSMEAFGRSVDVSTGGGYLRAEELFGRLLDCNSPRVYTLDRARLAATTPSD
jgi:hypothetical protein